MSDTYRDLAAFAMLSHYDHACACLYCLPTRQINVRYVNLRLT